MKKSLLVLLLAVLLPSLLLGGLALRTTREQQIILERRTAELCQKETDTTAAAARAVVAERRQAFSDAVRELLAKTPAPALAPRFATALREHWSQPAVGFALDPRGRVLAPAAPETAARPEAAQFLRDNREFIGGHLAAPVYNVPRGKVGPPQLQQQAFTLENQQALRAAPEPGAPGLKGAPEMPQSDAGASGNRAALQQQYPGNLTWSRAGSRRVAPLNNANIAPGNLKSAGEEQTAQARKDETPAQPPQLDAPESEASWTTAEFRELTAQAADGVVNRFVRDRLNMIFWVKPAEAAGYIFGCALRAEDLASEWPSLLTPSPGAEPDLIVALLDDQARPVAVHPAGSTVPDWKRPFAASEIGEALPHWEAALYLRNPERLAESAAQVRRNLYLLISCALAAIAAGAWVVVADTRRQLALAQKKTDFVSNVSHELKTPLTSIRMFAELMHSGRADAERLPQYLRIIMVEAERLTRLINNVLDFARLERKQRRFEMRPLDLHKLLSDLWPAQELHLREAGFSTHWEAAPPPYPILGDEDALAQAIVNLLSNAEKYGAERKEIALHSYLEGAWACVSILDRGAGVPTGEEAKIFEPFYRAHDSLSSGIPGTGLGLSLARRVIREHGGEILYQERPGGGANFTIRLPLDPTALPA